MNKKYCILSMNQMKSENTCDIFEVSPFDIGIPLVDISDETIKEIYYYRWHNFCSHIKNTPLGYIVTEFTPSVSWEGPYGSIVCPAGHHMYEGRWLHNKEYMDQYARFWFKEDVDPFQYSMWFADAIYGICKVTGDFSLAESLYENLKENYDSWEKKCRLSKRSQLLYQIDDDDGMEFSASGNGCRPTINSYQYGDAVALSKIAERLGKIKEKEYYENEYNMQKNKIDSCMWDKDSSFYKNIKNGYWLCDIREIMGYIPWYFNLPDEDKNEAWKFLNDENYFYAPFGPTTAEQNHPDFMKNYPHMCLWNGPSWPFATSQTLTALGNFLCNYKQDIIRKTDYFKLLKLYAQSQYDTDENGAKTPYIDENLDPYTGEWLARKIMREGNYDEFDKTRGVHYNHSTFCDLVLTGLAGIRARDDEMIEINPLFEEDDLEYFCADGILYHNHYIAVLWDKTGKKYHKGAGLKVYIDGILKAESSKIIKIVLEKQTTQGEGSIVLSPEI